MLESLIKSQSVNFRALIRNRNYASFALGALLFNLAAVALQTYLEYRHVSPSGGPDPFFCSALFLLPICLSILGIPFFLFALCFRKHRRSALYALTFGGIALLTLVAAGLLQRDPSPRLRAFQALGERLMPLVDAIERYRQDHHEYPAKLEALVPRYLPALPATGMANYPEYDYYVGPRAVDRYDGNPWVIVMRAGHGLGFDSFMYFPKQNYPEHGYGGTLVRLGRWAYVQE